jgi:actin-like ATPase involved in cell morphogenesis
MNEDIAVYAVKYNLLIGRMAERAKTEIGIGVSSAGRTHTMRGRNLITGCPKQWTSPRLNCARR